MSEDSKPLSDVFILSDEEMADYMTEVQLEELRLQEAEEGGE